MGTTSSCTNEDRNNLKRWQSNQLKKVTVDIGKGGAHPWTEKLSSDPLAFLHHNFLSKKECGYLINLAKPHMERSQVTDIEGKTVHVKYSSDRTSTGMNIWRGQNTIIHDIETRIADQTSIPKEHGENLHVLHYEVGQKFVPHFDTYEHELFTKYGGHRMATFLMYLSDVEEGGETVFPNAKGNFREEYKCAKGGLSVKPKMGDALLFWSIRPDGTIDPASLHGGNPVIKGDKWSCTKWMHFREIET